ncbi:ROK family protein [Carnobacterium sp.]|uniref:ROK family protein n=1 Tax=Carnobacterium sp. TaxID=48221 RepID=UPI002FCC9350
MDLGGTKVMIGEVTVEGQVLAHKKYPSVVTSQKKALETIKEALVDYQKTVGFIGEIQGMGVALVGRVNYQTGIWIEIHPELSEEIDVVQELQKIVSVPCFLANDVYCASLAELEHGFGNLTKNFVYLNIGTGIAARMVIEGQIIAGNHYDAGEIGHMVVDINSQIPCICGRYGCSEVLASGLGMSNRIKQLALDYPTSIFHREYQGDERVATEEIFDAYDQGDKLAQVVIDQALKTVAAVIMNLVRTCDPDGFVLGGGVVLNGWFLEKLQPYLSKKTNRFLSQGIAITTLDTRYITLIGCSILVQKGLVQFNV